MFSTGNIWDTPKKERPAKVAKADDTDAAKEALPLEAPPLEEDGLVKKQLVINYQKWMDQHHKNLMI